MTTTLATVFNTWESDSYYEEDRKLDSWEEEATLPSDDILVYKESHKWIVSHIPKGANIAVNGELIVLGDVCADAVVTCSSGGAEILIKGNVHEGAVVAASGGGAKVVVDGAVSTSAGIGSLGGGAIVCLFGKVDEHVQIRSEGGSAKVFFFAPTGSYAYVNGGGAEVLKLDSKRASGSKKLMMSKTDEFLTAPMISKKVSDSSQKSKSHNIFGFTLDIVLRKRS